jgi:hypothetical protein
MTAKTTPGQAMATTGRPAEAGPARQARQPSSVDRILRYGIWLAIAARGLGDHRFQTNVITRILGAYALVSVIKDNEARPVRRTLDWYMRVGDPHNIKTLHEARQTLQPGER